MSEPRIPFMPGTRFDNQRSRHNVGHVFDVVDGVPVVRDATSENVVPVMVAPEPERPVAPKPAGTYVPDYVALDRKVLRFFASFQETVLESQTETKRVRYVNIYVFLVDGTIAIQEPAVPNSGIPQGKVLARSKVPRSRSDPGSGQEVSSITLCIALYKVRVCLVAAKQREREEACPALAALVRSLKEEEGMTEEEKDKAVCARWEKMEMTQEFQVELVTSRQKLRNNVNANRYGRSITAQFTVGPDKHPFSVFVSCDDTEGDQDIAFKTDICAYRENTYRRTKRPTPPQDKDVRAFMESAGLPLTTCVPESWWHDDEALKKHLSQDTLHMLVYAEIMYEAIELLTGEHGENCPYGVPLGVDGYIVHDLLGMPHEP
ncbi:hypothetical protein KIPB_005905 [Kipferlia bialata]|uniref:DM10 domain-containing protein n=1 Tax=Kipferlia bialata TaxID=797122 RepID=A0A9K3CU65_9EUKA|nr:hypothetical protein KIPB_002741 [Kipferlia bialata]GIQ82997.1 hypothetical protein KIPB_004236 [Kipferlia bialata]GIQ84420.1 hypothetical protein KIPB_005905 [Kipferlia bialata]|eukprot:g2741.t1